MIVGPVVGLGPFGPGKVSQAFDFNGSNYVQIPDSLSLRPAEQITVDGWIRPDYSGRPAQSADIDTILAKFDAPSGAGYELFVVMDSTFSFPGGFPGGTVQVGIPGPGGTVQMGTPGFYLNVGNTSHQFFAPSPLDAQFHHIAASYDGTMIRLYVDGVEVNREKASGGIVHAATADASIGFAPSTPRYSRASIDEVELFNRALSASEVLAIFNAGSAGKC